MTPAAESERAGAPQPSSSSAAPPTLASVRADWRADRARYMPGPAGWIHEPALWAVATYRFGRAARLMPGAPGLLARAAHGVLHLLMRITVGIELPATAQIGPGLHVFHQSGIVLGKHVVIGARCRMRQGVTVGVGSTGGASPVLGDDVFLGPYAQVLGGITVGDGAEIGPLAVVTRDVPAGGRVRSASARHDAPA